MRQMSRGFTLIELMIVVAIIGILAAIALPAYQNFVVRAKLTEGMVGVAQARTYVGEAFQTGGMVGLAAATANWNANLATTASKYVQKVEVTNAAGEITLTVLATGGNGLPSSLNGLTLIFTPSIAGATLSPASTGTIDWSCASQTNTTATARSLPYKNGTLPARFVPSECR